MSASNEPIFILCPARSGSTLLRLILDAHPDVVAPPELNLAVIFAAIEFAMVGAVDDEARAQESVKQMSRDLASQIIGQYMRERDIDKPRWCDKSLPSIEHAELLARIFPGAKFICLYRNCRDNIASLLEASPWGLGGYGVESYARSFPNNAVLALAQHWMDKTAAMLTFEQSGMCFRMRYEDLVTSPATVMRDACAFLGLAWDERILSVEDSSPLGRGDHKTRYIRGFDQSSIGRGWTVPWELVPEPLQAHIAEASASLGYPDPADASASLVPRGARGLTADSTDCSKIEAILSERVARHANTRGDAQPSYRRLALEIIDTHERWLIDLDQGVARSNDSADCTILADAQAVIGIAQQELNPAVLVRQSRLQFRRDSEDAMSVAEVVDCLDQFVELIQAP